MAAVVPFLPLISAGVAGFGAIMQGLSMRAAGKYNAAMMRQNAKLAMEEATMLATQQERENYMRLGSIRAAQGKSGGSGSEGSVLDVIGDAAAQGELQKQYIIRQGEMKAAGFQSTATLDEAMGRNAATAGVLTAGSELLSGTSTYLKQT